MINDSNAQKNRSLTVANLMHELEAVDTTQLFSEVNQKKYETVCTLLKEAATAYYNGEESGISDLTFDHYIQTLRRWEESGVVLMSQNSPTKVNGGLPTDNVPHEIPMLSLRDVFSVEELQLWVDTVPDLHFTVEPKIDGLSVELWYFKGKLIKAVTRGNGLVGEDVTDKARAIASIPNTINYSGKLVVRGEVYMSKSAFENYRNKEDLAAKNPRNTAVGLFKRKDGGSAAGLYLDCLVFNVQYIDKAQAIFVNHTETLEWLKNLKFSVVPYTPCSSSEETRLAIETIKSQRDGLPYQIDGAVIKINNLAQRFKMGDNGAVPRWAIAFKYPAPEVSTRLISIDYQLGKTGKLAPVAILEPVDVDGSTVSRCTLHNKNRMQSLDIRVGDRVFIHKAGDIIPQISKVEHTPESQPFSYPTTCPVCGTLLEGEFCVNDYCPSRIQYKLQFWVSKEGLNIKGVSNALVTQLMEKGLLESPADYYNLLPKDLYLLPKMGAAKIKNTLAAIAASKQSPFGSVITAMAIEGVGSKAAFKIAEVVGDWSGLQQIDLATCTQTIGQAAGTKLYEALQTPYYQNLIERLSVIFPFDEKS